MVIWGFSILVVLIFAFYVFCKADVMEVEDELETLHVYYADSSKRVKSYDRRIQNLKSEVKSIDEKLAVIDERLEHSARFATMANSYIGRDERINTKQKTVAVKKSWEQLEIKQHREANMKWMLHNEEFETIEDMNKAIEEGAMFRGYVDGDGFINFTEYGSYNYLTITHQYDLEVKALSKVGKFGDDQGYIKETVIG